MGDLVFVWEITSEYGKCGSRGFVWAIAPWYGKIHIEMWECVETTGVYGRLPDMEDRPDVWETKNLWYMKNMTPGYGACGLDIF